jgi:hypothetical protein
MRNVMAKITILLSAFFLLLGVTAGNSKQPGFDRCRQQSEREVTVQEPNIRITIASVGPMLGLPTTRYRIGEQIPITITMTNTSSQPVDVCVSGDLYQDLPTLTKDGKLLPFSTWQATDLRNAQQDQACQRYDLPDRILLKPNEPRIVDWLTVVDDSSLPTGAMAWYDPLTPGLYQLSIQRRLGCCDGLMVESNRISFEVEP